MRFKTNRKMVDGGHSGTSLGTLFKLVKSSQVRRRHKKKEKKIDVCGSVDPLQSQNMLSLGAFKGAQVLEQFLCLLYIGEKNMKDPCITGICANRRKRNYAALICCERKARYARGWLALRARMGVVPKMEHESRPTQIGKEAFSHWHRWYHPNTGVQYKAHVGNVPRQDLSSICVNASIPAKQTLLHSQS